MHTRRISFGIGDYGAAVAATIVLTAALIGYELSNGNEKSAVALCLIPAIAIMLARPASLLVPIGATLPVLLSFTVAGKLVTISDVLLVIVFGGILLQAAVTGSAPAIRALKPIAGPIMVYVGFLVVLLSVHHNLGVILGTGQRLELFLVPLVIGAFAALAGRQTRMLQAYVLVTTVIAAAWPILDHYTWNKNPVGQLIGGGIILLIGVPSLRRLLPCLAILVPMLLVTQSRGAIVATGVGAIVVMIMQGLNVRTIITRTVPVALIAAIAFSSLSLATKDRITTFSAGTDSKAAYALTYRLGYKQGAWRIIRAHPWAGIGVGNYLAASRSIATSANDREIADDPHQVLLLQAAEGGFVLAAAFVLLIVGSIVALHRMRRVTLAPAAAGVLVATFVHGLVDVYWVRVTPVLGWVLAGMVCGLYAKRRHSEAPIR